MVAGEIVAAARREGRRILCEDEAKEVLRRAGVPVVPCRLAASEDEAVALAEEMGYPVVLKVRSPLIVHKTEAGGVALDLRGEAEVRRAYRGILSRAAALDPRALVSVQPMAPPGREVIVGVTGDPHFGPVIMAGLGGVLAEILEDVSFRLLPVAREEAVRMLRSLRGYRLLAGYRGVPPADIEALADLLVKVSGLMEAHPEIGELDLNPVLVYERGLVVADARLVLAG
ncbi:acetate--CoA ligase family protein [Desulfovirgula thermocuniculi]|uniref:acetate--CoA ligase family protein n=1 Tax=Desulfovirgula thermocuniculi TaxID=348842 RepID=UPI000416A730|nr:acetate--CoA ligase family protein [Desulfovirgula thermocuniculi]